MAPGRARRLDEARRVGTGGSWPLVAETLKHWREDSDLAGVREAKALEALPEAERKAGVACGLTSTRC